PEDQRQRAKARGKRHQPDEYGRGRIADGEGRGRDPEHTQAEKRENRSADRDAASLPGRARFSERSESDQTADESVERARQTVEQFAADMADERRIREILRGWRHQLRGRAFARPLNRTEGVNELRQIDGIVVER